MGCQNKSKKPENVEREPAVELALIDAPQFEFIFAE
jgi:hypothetical protein